MGRPRVAAPPFAAASRDDGRCSSQGGARDIAQRCDVEAPLRAQWPDDAAEDGRVMEALVDAARAALRCVALCAMMRALPPRFRGGGAAVAGRRSGESPAMS
ncbi:hypothetical protein F511_47165 [Dorcoceras hygrometricum]|uniref:Uncharacterized protein n=1 Tax=Dorcoceras hygrometricum TaxID=472368 RepID=A0A2Z6ZZ01_9LAMI|nr:hypothetical protein F511_47165 [Dorcoceras hygrometricum]